MGGNSKVDLKVVLLGKEYGGKTCLVERFLYDRFHGDVPYQNTIGAAFGARKLQSRGGRHVTLGIWDTAGSERYQSMSRIYYRGARAAVVCYDLMDASSFERGRYWVEELKLHEERCRIYLCGTKRDLVEGDAMGRQRRQIDYHTLTDYGDEIDAAHVLETSSKTGENVQELFQRVADDFCNDADNFHTGARGGAGEEDRSRLKLIEPKRERGLCQGASCSR